MKATSYMIMLLLATTMMMMTGAVILSLEESELGENDYRYFYFNIEAFDSGYSKPFFRLTNDDLDRPYGTLGSLTCPTSTSGVAIYSDIDGDGLLEWNCQSINVLPFANDQDNTGPTPPLCTSTVSSGTPALWNNSLGEWYCAGFNHILTAARRGDETPCATADFMYYDAILDEIRCISPIDIDEVDTALGQRKRDTIERVDIDNDLKWHVVSSTAEVTGATNLPWNNWRWTPSINYDLDTTYSLVPSPPVALPLQTTVIAISIASFSIAGYSWDILKPEAREPAEPNDYFRVVVYKLTNNLGQVTVSDTLEFNSISASGGQTAFGLSSLSEATCEPGETFVAEIRDRSEWPQFEFSSNVHAVQLTLWMQVTNAAL